MPSLVRGLKGSVVVATPQVKLLAGVTVAFSDIQVALWIFQQACQRGGVFLVCSVLDSQYPLMQDLGTAQQHGPISPWQLRTKACQLNKADMPNQASGWVFPVCWGRPDMNQNYSFAQSESTL